MSIKILITGGTFDKVYNELKGTLTFRETHIREMLKLGRVNAPVDVEKVEMIDSLDMTLKDRVKIFEYCRKSKEKQIVITHGTDTMVQTAILLGKEMKKLRGKTIVLTGAIIPYAFGSSDGLFNLGCAMGFVQAMPSGVYIAMNGKCFTWQNVRKNKRRGVFEEKR